MYCHVLGIRMAICTEEHRSALMLLLVFLDMDHAGLCAALHSRHFEASALQTGLEKLVVEEDDL